MVAIVAYDSIHGSTKCVAEAIAEQMSSEGYQARLISGRERLESSLVGDFMFIGSQTRGGMMTNEAKAFIESLDVRYWKGKRIVTFDMIGPLSKDPQKRNRFIESISDWSRSAAWKMKELCENRGLAVTKTMHFVVVGMWGPIAPDGPDIARKQTHDFLKGLQ